LEHLDVEVKNNSAWEIIRDTNNFSQILWIEEA
jgi:hypothetical protein